MQEEFNPLSYFNKKKDQAIKSRSGFEKGWYRNILFYIGKQWIKYDNAKKSWSNVDLPDWFPTPVTNKYASTLDAVSSVLEEIQPDIVASPIDDNIKNVNSAEVARTIIDIIEEEAEFSKCKKLLSSWLILCGDVFLYSYYDNSLENGVIEVPIYLCNDCGYKDVISNFNDNKCPVCGGSNIIETDEKKTYPRGKIKTKVLSPFEVFVDLNIKDFDEHEYVLIASVLTKEQIKKRWDVEFKTDDKPGQDTNLTLFTSLAGVTNISNITTEGIGRFTDGGSNLYTVWEMFVKPNHNSLPNGWHGFICKDKILECGDLEYINGYGQRYIPIVHIGFLDVPKRFFSKTIADDLVSKQIQRNKIESFIQLASHRMSNPVWLIPKTAGVEKITGEPGEIIEFNDSNTAHGVPTRLPGVELTQSIFRWLQMIDEDFEELASTFDIIKGNVPPNVPTLGGLELLKERGLSRFGRLIKNVEDSYIKQAYIWLWLWKQFATDERNITIKDLNGKWKLKSFNNSDLSGNVNLRIEPGSSNPRSEAYKQYITGQLLGYGLVDITDPLVRYRVLRLFHANDINEALDIDFDYAERENLSCVEGRPPILRPEIDNHETHIASHLKFAKSEQFLNLPTDIKNIFEIHIKEHKENMMKQMANLNPQMSEGLDKQAINNVNNSSGQIGVETSQIENQGGL